MEYTYRVIAPKEGLRLGEDFDTRDDAEEFARDQEIRPVSVVKVIDKDTDAERYETVTQFT